MAFLKARKPYLFYSAIGRSSLHRILLGDGVTNIAKAEIFTLGSVSSHLSRTQFGAAKTAWRANVVFDNTITLCADNGKRACAICGFKDVLGVS